jgi:hypothetical protein
MWIDLKRLTNNYFCVDWQLLSFCFWIFQSSILSLRFGHPIYIQWRVQILKLLTTSFLMVFFLFLTLYRKFLFCIYKQPTNTLLTVYYCISQLLQVSTHARRDQEVFVCLLSYMIWYDIYLTAVGLTPGGSSTSHIYTQTVHLHTNCAHNAEIGK